MKESNAPAAALPQYREPEQSGRPLWLRVAAFDDEEIELRFSFAQRDCGLVVRRAIAVERRAKLGNSSTTVRARTLPSATSRRPPRTRKRPPNLPNGTMSAVMYAL